MKPPEKTTNTKLAKAVKNILAYTPPEPPKKPEKAPSKSELHKKWKLNL